MPSHAPHTSHVAEALAWHFGLDCWLQRENSLTTKRNMTRPDRGLIDAIFERFHLTLEEGVSEEQLLAAWKKVVPPFIETHARPYALKNHLRSAKRAWQRARSIPSF